MTNRDRKQTVAGRMFPKRDLRGDMVVRVQLAIFAQLAFTAFLAVFGMAQSLFSWPAASTRPTQLFACQAAM